MQIVFVHRKDLLWQMEDKLFNRRCKKHFLQRKVKCIVFSYTPPWEIIFISNEYLHFNCNLKMMLPFVKHTYLVAEAHFRSFDLTV